MDVQYDVIVVGAGWHGLAAAKTYMQLHPMEEVCILESEDDLGGVWSSRRLYPGLITQNMLDTMEYPDFPMSGERYGVRPLEHIPGAVINRYLKDYARHFGLYQRIKFRTQVESVTSSKEGGWTVGVVGDQNRLRTRKIIIATGIMTQPKLPVYPGHEAFAAPLFHARDFGQNAGTIETAKKVAIVGIAKSAFDVAYAYARAGVHVDLVARETGKGPVWMSYAWVMGGKRRMEKLFPIRVLSWLSPCPFGDADGWGWVRRLLHRTRIGRFLVDKFWGMMNSELIEMMGYDREPELKQLKPREPAFWMGTNLLLHNYDQNMLDMIKSGYVKVHFADVAKLTSRQVHLTNGEVLEADVLVCATGWKKEPNIRFVGFGEAGPFGLPYSPAEEANLMQKTDEKIWDLFPRLRDSPAHHMKLNEPVLRLYRFMVPLAKYNERSIAFAGFTSSASIAIVATVQALWISAYFDGRLDRTPTTEQEAVDATVLHTQWGKWRYPCGYGPYLPDFIFDALPYLDMLLTDLGLKVRRKRSLWQELFSPYAPPDYVDLEEEWIRRHPGG